MIILGIMSGTSLDGIDLAVCDIDGTRHNILSATTVPYSDEWRHRLATLEQASALEYAKTDVDLGHLMGRVASDFIMRQKITVDAVASHGHTIFHQPAIGLTTQIGCGNAIAAETGLPVVNDFRTLDVALGGQGAPLVPIGDELLFGRYDACLNLGGIANISFRADGKRQAYDICPCNMALNRLSARLGLDYDPDGCNARRGKVHTCLLADLDRLPYYRQSGPKSLGKEWFLAQFWPLVEASSLPTEDMLATVTSHIAIQIATAVKEHRVESLLVTGGGAFNGYLLELLSSYSPATAVTVPDELTVNYKEALIFALLGYLRLTGQVNTLASVTGARYNSIGGTVSGLTRSAAMPL